LGVGDEGRAKVVGEGALIWCLLPVFWNIIVFVAFRPLQLVTYPATDILDVYQACHPETPLEPGDPRYVDLREVRGGRNLARVIYRRIASTEPSDYHQHLITGHRGCGKSTELKQIKGALEDEDLFCVYFDVEEVLDVQDLKYLDVLLAVARVVARVVGERLDDEGMELPEELLTHLDD